MLGSSVGNLPHLAITRPLCRNAKIVGGARQQSTLVCPKSSVKRYCHGQVVRGQTVRDR